MAMTTDSVFTLETAVKMNHGGTESLEKQHETKWDRRTVHLQGEGLFSCETGSPLFILEKAIRTNRIERKEPRKAG